jgi:hypothetical protein
MLQAGMTYEMTRETRDERAFRRNTISKLRKSGEFEAIQRPPSAEEMRLPSVICAWAVGAVVLVALLVIGFGNWGSASVSAHGTSVALDKASTTHGTPVVKVGTASGGIGAPVTCGSRIELYGLQLESFLQRTYKAPKAVSSDLDPVVVRVRVSTGGRVSSFSLVGSSGDGNVDDYVVDKFVNGDFPAAPYVSGGGPTYDVTVRGNQIKVATVPVIGKK